MKIKIKSITLFLFSFFSIEKNFFFVNNKERDKENSLCSIVSKRQRDRQTNETIDQC